MTTEAVKVLLVEDNPGDIRLIRELLTKAVGTTFALECADRLATAINRLAEGDIDAVLLDLNLPDSLGLNTFLRLHTQAPHVPIVLLTGLEDEALGMRAVQEGAQDYLVKGRVESDLLSRALRYAVERKRVQGMLKALYGASLRILEPLELAERLDKLLETARTVLELDRVNILLADTNDEWLEAAASTGTTESLDRIRVPIGPEGGAIAQAYLGKETISWDGRGPVPEAWQLAPPYDRIEALQSTIFADVPLIAHGRAIGVLGGDRTHRQQPLTPATLELLQVFGAQAALAIEHGRLYEEQRHSAQRLEATVQARTQQLQTANLHLQQAMCRVEEASRFKSEFLANMSHELRTPLNAVIGFSELLMDERFGPLSEKQIRYVQNIWTGGKHLLELINDILDLSKVEAGKLVIQPEPFYLPDALRAVVNNFRPQAEEKGLHLELHVEDALTMLTADPLRFNQILFNLLSNAVKFTPDDGTVTITARPVDSSQFTAHGESISISEPSTANREPISGFVDIAVHDTGIGIKADDMPKLFQEFIQLDLSLAKQHQGTGLGLALTKKLVELHGGRIRAESSGEGQGSTFTVTLPLKGLNAVSDLEPSAFAADGLRKQPADPPPSDRGSTERTANGES